MGRGILGRSGGGASKEQRPSGWGVSCFLTVYDLGPTSAPFGASVSSFDNWDGVAMNPRVERIERREWGGVWDGSFLLHTPKSTNCQLQVLRVGSKICN